MKILCDCLKLVMSTAFMLIALEMYDRFTCYIGRCQIDDAAERASAIFWNPIAVTYVGIFWLLIFPVSRKLTKLVGHLAAFIIVIFSASSIIAIAMAQDDVKSFFWIFFGVFLPWIIAFSIFNIGYGKISNNVARVSE